MKRTISRREFTVRSAVVAATLGAAGIGGYSLLKSEKARMFLNYHRMGHCAPSVMQTLLDINNTDNPDLVRSAGALAGGIAGPKMECGALTAPLMFLGFQKGIPGSAGEKLLIIRQAQTYLNAFGHKNGSTVCVNIRNRHEDGCWQAVSGFYDSFINSVRNPAPLQAETEESYTILLSAFNDNRFHCCHSMLDVINAGTGVKRELYDISWPYLGGIALLNRTCGVLSAGVMVLSSFLAGIENSYSGVARMNKMLKKGDKDAMKDEANAFNRAINTGYELGNWFRKEFGSTSCFDICGYNFSRGKDVSNYLSGNCMERCHIMTKKAGEKVISLLLRPPVS